MGYHYTIGAFCWLNQIVKDQRAPSENRTHAAALRKRCHSTRPSVLNYFGVGSVGIEPTSAGLRDRCITLSATIPFVFVCPSRRGRNRTFDRRLIRTLLEPLSCTPTSEVGRIRTYASRIKSPLCCRYTTTSCSGYGYAFQAAKSLPTISDRGWSYTHRCSPCRVFVVTSVVGLRIELSATRLSDGYGHQPSPTINFKSGTSGSNRKPPAPKAGVLPSAPLPESPESSE